MPRTSGEKAAASMQNMNLASMLQAKREDRKARRSGDKYWMSSTKSALKQMRIAVNEREDMPCLTDRLHTKARAKARSNMPSHITCLVLTKNQMHALATGEATLAEDYSLQPHRHRANESMSFVIVTWDYPEDMRRFPSEVKIGGALNWVIGTRVIPSNFPYGWDLVRLYVTRNHWDISIAYALSLRPELRLGLPSDEHTVIRPTIEGLRRISKDVIAAATCKILTGDQA